MPSKEKTSKGIEECHDIYYNFRKEITVGDYDYVRPDPPDVGSVINFGLENAERVFPLHDRDVIDTLTESELTIFVAEEQRRLDEGLHFYNKDNLEYVTGKHYFMLQWWILQSTDGGLYKTPDFIDAQRDGYYHWDCAEKDSESLGAVWGTCRGWGKTAVGGNICYTTAMMLEGAKCAIQSKTSRDAIEVFLKIQESWQRMPDFFKPIDTGETKRSNALLFTAPQKKNSKGDVKEYKYVLDSWIKPFAANNTALDGLRFRFGYFDEEGKVEKGVAEVDERWEVNARCFVSRDKVIGKSLHTTTVEDMERLGGAKFKKIWDDSNPKTIDPLLKRTKSGLRRLFVPADYGYKVDKWGYSDREYAKTFHEAEMAKRSGADLIAYRRKYPLRESDMWLMESTGSPWALAKIQQQSQYNEDEGTYTENRRGNFYWNNGEDSQVGFQEDKDNGRWTVAWMPPQEDRNQYRISEYGREPTREHVRIGIDPTNLKAPVVGSGSDNAAYAVLDTGYMGNKAPRAVCEYLYRQDHPTDFAEDMRMMAVFYSAKVFVENNAGSVLIRHFENKRCQEYLMYNELEKDQKKKFKERGFYNATNGGIRENLVNVTRAHIVDDIGYIEVDQTGNPVYGSMPFPLLIEDLQDFEVDNWTPYDATVAYMIAILACKMSRMNVDTSELSTPSDYNVMNLHRKYRVK
tara:strand:+ start:3310 stop:5373 length:2064 start_codon:yes stop_codon:yes gene_type:complete